MKTTTRITGICSIILLLILLMTDPQRLPSVFLIVPFVLLFIIIAALVPLVPGVHQLPRRKIVKMGMAIAAIPVLLLILQSLGQLTFRDVFAIVALFGVAYFYMARFGAPAVG